MFLNYFFLNVAMDTRIISNSNFPVDEEFGASVLNIEFTKLVNKGNNKITELRTILQRESQNS
jgi:hypothetical protein